MTDRYADLRKATHLRSIFCSPEAIFGYRAAANHETITALLADYDRLREALEESQSLFAVMLHEQRPTSEIQAQMIENRAALTQEQGGSDAT